MRYLFLDISNDDVTRRSRREANDPTVRNALCGEKELLRYALSNSPKIGKGTDLAKYAKIDLSINEVEDPDWFIMNEEDWSLIKDKINHESYGLQVKDQNGNDSPLYSAPLKRMIGTLISNLDSASNEMPEKLKKEMLMSEAKKAS